MLSQRIKDITGMRLGRVNVLRFDRVDGRGKAPWIIKCECGTVKSMDGGRLTRGEAKSCGCLALEVRIKTGKATIRHGHGNEHSPTYRTWQSMLSRCRNPNTTCFNRYGGRGITVCERWNEFTAFLEDMGIRPNGKTIERKDANGNYEPDNCRWATPKEQQNNMASNRRLEWSGCNLTVSQWAEKLSINKATLFSRIRQGWPVQEVLYGRAAV